MDPDLDESSDESSDDSEELTIQQLYYKPPTIDEANRALEKLDAAIRKPRPSGPGFVYADLDRVTNTRYAAMIACLNYYTDPKSKGFIDASECAAKGQTRGSTYARSIRKWIRRLIKSGNLPENHQGQWNISTLDDEDVANEIKLHLQQVGKYVSAEDLAKFLQDPDTRARLKIVRKVSLRTAQRWLLRHGYRWRAELKGQYFDGHERPDVVAYRQTTFIPLWRALERQRIIFKEDGTPDPKHRMFLLPGEKPILVWFHDESIFYANDRRLVRWVHIDEHAKPFKKGEGKSIMVADLFCPEVGWLRGPNG